MHAEGRSLPEHLSYAEVMTRTGVVATRHGRPGKSLLVAVDDAVRTASRDLRQDAGRTSLRGVAAVDDIKIRRAKLVGQNIKLARQQLGWNQEHLAAQLGMPRHHVSRWEIGGVEPSPANLARLAELLGQAEWWFYQPHDEDTD